MMIEFNRSHLDKCLELGYKYMLYQNCIEFALLTPMKFYYQPTLYAGMVQYQIPIDDDQLKEIISCGVDLIPDFKFYINTDVL